VAGREWGALVNAPPPPRGQSGRGPAAACAPSRPLIRPPRKPPTSPQGTTLVTSAGAVTKSWSAHTLRLEAVAEGVPLYAPPPLAPDADGPPPGEGGGGDGADARVQGWLSDTAQAPPRAGMMTVPAACRAPNPLARAPALPAAAPAAFTGAPGPPQPPAQGGGGPAGAGRGEGGGSGGGALGSDSPGDDDDFDISLAQVILDPPLLPSRFGAFAPLSSAAQWPLQPLALSRPRCPSPHPDPRNPTTPPTLPPQIIPAEELTLIERIGQGAEGRVFLGRWNHIEVAAKEFFTGEEAGGGRGGGAGDGEGHLRAQVRTGGRLRGLGIACAPGGVSRGPPPKGACS
jgi:hypothetical protein